MKKKLLILGITMSGLACAQSNGWHDYKVSNIGKYNQDEKKVYKIRKSDYDKFRLETGAPEIKYWNKKWFDMFVNLYQVNFHSSVYEINTNYQR